ncbi:MAG: hypothetical protein IPL32_11235 [Chloracidobacterium sp.]|nr:hypothetical protein [Chloracidobacterium sp.]
MKSPRSILNFTVLVATTILAFGSFASFAQKTKSTGPKFDTIDFAKKSELAQWLVEYDEVAWKTTDVLMTEDKAEIAKLGGAWFCFQDGKKLWHAVYGKLANDKYDLVFHYLFDSTGKITKTTEKTEQDFLNTHAKALATAGAALTAKIGPNSPTFNQYIRLNADKTFDVWLFPAFQTNGVALYGMEGIYHIDPTGSKIIADKRYLQKGLRGFKTTPPREIWLDYREIEKPTLGSVFFVWYYKTYFTDIYIDNSKSTSTVIKAGENGYMWVNVEKDDKKEAKPK